MHKIPTKLSLEALGDLLTVAGGTGGMPVEPGDVWRNLPATLRRQVSEDLAVVLRGT